MAILIILNRRILKGMRVLNNSRRGPAQPQEEQQFVNNAAAERSQCSFQKVILRQILGPPFKFLRLMG